MLLQSVGHRVAARVRRSLVAAVLRQEVHVTPHTLHHTPYTTHHIPYTLHHIPYTLLHPYWLCRMHQQLVLRLAALAHGALQMMLMMLSCDIITLSCDA